MTRTELKQIASILPPEPEITESPLFGTIRPESEPQSAAHKLTQILNTPHNVSISGKTAAIEQECPLFGGRGPIEQQGLFAPEGDKSK